MRFTEATTPTYLMGTVIASGGTVTTAGIDWSPNYETSAKLVLTVGATPAGTVAATLQSSNVSGSGYVAVGGAAIAVPGSDGGSAVYEVDAAGIPGRYVRAVVTSTGGTALVGGVVLGKKRTVTS